ncbi:MAG: hypothetical protein GF416_06185 [Candidatus Altiarchaeales archaeon]|nr:hypothetical protein [Candidatus Altiarchaeales archaeon]MBD3416704.1 hypothetical protein [Candidatus Altiarchaeales archaeon]
MNPVLLIIGFMLVVAGSGNFLIKKHFLDKMESTPIPIFKGDLAGRIHTIGSIMIISVGLSFIALGVVS